MDADPEARPVQMSSRAARVMSHELHCWSYHAPDEVFNVIEVENYFLYQEFKSTFFSDIRNQYGAFLEVNSR